jgi:hypothetical protein
MDPYIEDPEIWSDFYNNLASEIQGQLNPLIRPRYVARLIPRVTNEVVGITRARGVGPDVGIWGKTQSPRTVRETAGTVTPAPVTSSIELEFPLELVNVEIQTTDSHELVTAIEILSPVNKKPGHEAFEEYLRKRRELLRSAAHLIEIDLLRAGVRPPLQEPVPDAPYYIILSRASHRPEVDVWPLQLKDRLPVLPVPLRDEDPDVALDLAAAFAAVYERGGYADLIDYRRTPPPPPLADAAALWLDELLHTHGAR